MRILFIAVTILILTACGSKTPPCTDPLVTSHVTELAEYAISEELLQNDPDLAIDKTMSRINLALENISTTEHEKSIDKHSCAANLHVDLPAGVAALKNHAVFRSLTGTALEVDVQSDAIVTPVTYTTYRSIKDKQVVIRLEGENVPAKYVQVLHKAGVFDSDLSAPPDLHGGLTIYSSKDKNVLIEPTEDGTLRFRINYQNSKCQAWMQTMTEERNDTLIYDNKVVGCRVTFSRLGVMMLVEHSGCERMPRNCYPDGIYQKQ